MNSKIKIIAIVLLIILVAVGAYCYHNHQKSENEIQRAKIGMMNMTIEVMNREIETAEESNYAKWNERIGILDFMLSNLEYNDSKELGDYDDVCDLIEKVSEIHSPGNKERKLLHRVQDIKFIRTVNNKEAKIKFNKSEDKTIIEKL